jgi:hypothetical protein
MLCWSASHLQTPILSLSGLFSCSFADPVQFGWWQTQQHNTRHNTQPWSCLPHRCIRENTRISFTDHIHSLRAQALPLSTVSYKQKSLIVPPVLVLSLSLSLSLSLLYVLLQQWAKPHIRRSGRSRTWPNSLLRSYLLFSLLLSFSKSIPVSSSPSPQCLLSLSSSQPCLPS